MTFNLNMRTIMMIGIALIAAAFTALLARGWINSQRAAFTPAEHAQEVLVAKTDLGPGRFVKPQDLRWQGWPQGTLAPVYVVKGKRPPEDFDGAVVRKGLVAGQPITDAQVVRPGEQGFLAAVLSPGMRAVSIQVNAITGISGFVLPGDRVDMVLTHTVPTPDRRQARHVSETVLQDIRVIAVDQKIDDTSNKASVAKTVTFEVTPKQVEKIGIISKIGKISLSLRPIVQEPAPVAETGDVVTDAAAAARAVEMAQPRPESRPAAEAAPESPPASLSPIAAASAAEMTEDAAGEGTGPVELFDEAAKADADARDDVEPRPAAKAKARRSAEPVPRRERAGITMDSEVSRVLGREPGRSGRSVKVVRGSKADDQKF